MNRSCLVALAAMVLSTIVALAIATLLADAVIALVERLTR